MPWHPLARLKIGAAFFTPASNSASMPGLTSICAISVIISRPIAAMIVYDCNRVLPQCVSPAPRGSRNVMAERLLAADEPPPVTVGNEHGSSPFLLVADHAGNIMPRALGR